MAYWLMKSEPEEFGWDDLIEKGEAMWDGVRNHQAANNMREMAVGDAAFFYHSGPSAGKIGPHIVGIMTVSKPASPDPGDSEGKWVVVHVKPDEKLASPVALSALKEQSALADMKVVRQPRLSVSPVSEGEWNIILDMAKRG